MMQCALTKCITWCTGLRSSRHWQTVFIGQAVVVYSYSYHASQ